MNKRRAGLLVMITGILALAAGLGLSGYNLWDDYRAGVQADDLLKAVVQHQKEALSTEPDETASPAVSPDPEQTPPAETPAYSERGLPVLEVDGRRYIGTVSIPVIDVTLPVQEDWSLALLEASPCRYMGSPYQGDLIICAHDYTTHFGRLKNLSPGDQVIFADVEGNEFLYAVAEIHAVAGTAVEAMMLGEWDLTLFTCTPNGLWRTTVRCDLLESGEVQH